MPTVRMHRVCRAPCWMRGHESTHAQLNAVHAQRHRPRAGGDAPGVCSRWFGPTSAYRPSCHRTMVCAHASCGRAGGQVDRPGKTLLKELHSRSSRTFEGGTGNSKPGCPAPVQPSTSAAHVHEHAKPRMQAVAGVYDGSGHGWGLCGKPLCCQVRTSLASCCP